MRLLSVGLCLGLSVLFACQKSGPEISGTPERLAKPAPKDPDEAKPKARVPAKHRAVAIPCPKESTRATHEDRMPIAEGPACSANADCKDEKNGRCNAKGHCTYDKCYLDGDCGTGGVCVCSEEGRQGYTCQVGNCSIDGDCGGGQYCSPSPSLECGYFQGTIGWFCHGRSDDCVDDADCSKGASEAPRGYCAYSAGAKKWVCGYGICRG